jgi:hypothetical protein
VNTDTASAEGAHADFHVVTLSLPTLREHEAGNFLTASFDFASALPIPTAKVRGATSRLCGCSEMQRMVLADAVLFGVVADVNPIFLFLGRKKLI